MSYQALKELLSEAIHDAGVPESVPQLLGWIIRFCFRLWDTPVVREWRETQKDLKAKGVFSSTYSEQYEYAVAQKIGRNVYSVRRSLERIRKWYDKKGTIPHGPTGGPGGSGRFSGGRFSGGRFS